MAEKRVSWNFGNSFPLVLVRGATGRSAQHKCSVIRSLAGTQIPQMRRGSTLPEHLISPFDGDLTKRVIGGFYVVNNELGYEIVEEAEKPRTGRRYR